MLDFCNLPTAPNVNIRIMFPSILISTVLKKLIMVEYKSLFEAVEPFVVTLLDLLLKIHLGVLKQEIRCDR